MGAMYYDMGAMYYDVSQYVAQYHYLTWLGYLNRQNWCQMSLMSQILLVKADNKGQIKKCLRRLG